MRLGLHVPSTTQTRQMAPDESLKAQAQHRVVRPDVRSQILREGEVQRRRPARHHHVDEEGDAAMSAARGNVDMDVVGGVAADSFEDEARGRVAAADGQHGGAADGDGGRMRAAAAREAQMRKRARGKRSWRARWVAAAVPM